MSTPCVLPLPKNAEIVTDASGDLMRCKRCKQQHPLGEFVSKTGNRLVTKCKRCHKGAAIGNAVSNAVHNPINNPINNPKRVGKPLTPRKKQRNHRGSKLVSSSLLATKLAASMAATDEAEPMLALDSPELLSEVSRQVQVVAAQVERLKSTSASATVYVSVGNTARSPYTTEVAGSLTYDSCPLRDRSNAKLVRGAGDISSPKHIGFQYSSLKVCANNENCNQCKWHTLLLSLFF